MKVYYAVNAVLALVFASMIWWSGRQTRAEAATQDWVIQNHPDWKISTIKCTLDGSVCTISAEGQPVVRFHP